MVSLQAAPVIEKLRVVMKHDSDSSPLDCEEEDSEYMASWRRGEWHFVGMYAEAEIRTPSGLSQTIRSGGLWGIESDLGEAYLRMIGAEEVEVLKDELSALGIPTDRNDLFKGWLLVTV